MSILITVKRRMCCRICESYEENAMKRIMIFVFIVLVAVTTGCRTGNYKFDEEIYAKMPDLLKNDPQISQKIAYNQDGSPIVSFDKGTMFITMADGLDQGTRQQIVSRAIEIFHQQYLDSPDAKKQDGSFRRDKIYLHGLVGETELYIIEWKLGAPAPLVTNNREGNYM
jgi:hypothetical protein